MMCCVYDFNRRFNFWFELSKVAKCDDLIFLFCVLFLIPLHAQSQRVVYSETDRQAILEAHNQERRLVGNQDLTWDYDLEEFAADWATTLSMRGSGLSHRPNNKYGENCYWSSSSYVSPEAAILAFNDEKADYYYGPVSYQNFSGTGHYTQVVWYRTTKVGCAAVSGNSGTFVVCNYNPPGNLIGDYPYRRETNRIAPIEAPVKINEVPDVVKSQSGNLPSPQQNQSILRQESRTPITSQIPLESTRINKPVKSEIAEVNSSQSNVKSLKNDRAMRNGPKSQQQPFFVIFSGVESWTRFQHVSIMSQIKSKSEIGFSGASPSFQLVSTLPRKRIDNISDIRGILSVGFTLSNRILQQDLNNCLGLLNSEPRLYSPMNCEFGLQCWKYCQITVGKTIFGLMETKNAGDYSVLNKCGLRFIVPLGRDFTFSVNTCITGHNFEITNWEMANVGVSLRSKFY